MPYDPNDQNTDPQDPYSIISRYRRAMQQANDPNSASGVSDQDVQDQQNSVQFQNFQQGLAKSAQTQSAPPPLTPSQTPYSPGSNNYPSNSIQTNQFGSGLQETLARIQRGQYLSQQQQQPGNQNFQMQGVTYPQFNQNAQNQSGQNGQGGAQPGTQSGQTGQQSFQNPQGGLDYNSLLKFYGVNQPAIRQSPFVSNDFMQNHPALGGALNSALFAAAGTQTERGPSGAGTGISNVLRGVAGVPGAEREFQMNQQLAPLQMADAMAKLYGSTSQANMYQAHANYYNSITPERLAAAQLRADTASGKLGQPVYGKDNQLLGFMGANGFQSRQSLNIPDDAAKPSNTSPTAINSQYSKAGRIAGLVSGGMPMAQAIAQAEREFVVNPQNAINNNRNNAPGGPNDRQDTQLQNSIYNRYDSDIARADAAHQKRLADPMMYDPKTRAEEDANWQRDRQASADFRDQQLTRLQQQRQSASPSGRKAPRNAGNFANSAPQGQVSVQIPGSPAGLIPQSQLQKFKADHPNAIIGQGQ